MPYVVVDTKQQELDYPSGTGSIYTNYAGKGGIPIGGFFRRLVFAYHYRDINLLISGLITGQSKILIYRDLTTRVQKVAPFLKYDGDPYAAVVGGHLFYIWDAYTTTSAYPYSQEVDLADATGQHLSGQANYIRNSVKVVMNAYDGTLRFYVTDPNDPLIQVWRAAFPALFLDVSQAPAELVQHFRYPEDLLSIQASQFATYHVTDPSTFYSRGRQWALPSAPARPQTEPPKKSTQNTPLGPFFPYYVLSKIPGSDSEHFVLFEPFSPPNRTNMVAYLAAGSDGYGTVSGYGRGSP